MKIRLLFVAAIAYCMQSLSARDFSYEYKGARITYTVLNEATGTCEVAKYQYFNGELTLPEHPYDGSRMYTLTSIGGGAFCINAMNGDITKVTIPNTVTSIGAGAFQRNKITSVDIPSSVTYIGDGAFHSNPLTSLTIPGSVTYIGELAFYKHRLKTVSIPGSVTTIGDWAFMSDTLKEVFLEDGTATLELSCRAFRNSADDKMLGLEYLYLGRNLSYQSGLPESPFAGCRTLKELSIGNHVTTIGDYLFYDCSSIQGALKLPSSLTSIGRYAFSGCHLPGVLKLPSSLRTIGNYAFQYCSGLSGDLVIPEGVTSIGDRVFYSCEGYADATLSLPSTLKSLAYLCFSNSNFKKIYSYSTVPPVAVNMYTPPFTATNYEATLYVPGVALEAYKNSDLWKKFFAIKAIDGSGIDIMEEDRGDILSLSDDGITVNLNSNDSYAEIKVYDMGGAIRLRRLIPAGTVYCESFGGHTLPSGLYIITLTTSTSSLSRKFSIR